MRFDRVRRSSWRFRLSRWFTAGLAVVAVIVWFLVNSSIETTGEPRIRVGRLDMEAIPGVYDLQRFDSPKTLN